MRLDGNYNLLTQSRMHRLRGTAATLAIVGRAPTRLTQLDSQLILENATMSQRMSDTVAQPRFYAAMLGAFAFVALERGDIVS